MADTTNPTGYDEALQHAHGFVKNWGGGEWSDYEQRLKDFQNQFSNQFTNLVGRAPTTEEVNKYYSDFVRPNDRQLTDLSSTFEQNYGNNVKQFIGDTFQQQAQDVATQKLQEQQGQANSLADLFRGQGNSAINSTEQSLLDYQSKLFDRLRPNLITSLQSQGLLNTGGMNEAIAGVQGDLANNASNYIAQLKYNNEQGANQIAFGGASAPYYYKQGAIMQNPANMAATAGNATNFNNNTFMSNLDYQHQLGLIHQQAMDQQGLQPSFMQTFGQSAATNLGANFNGPAWAQGVKDNASKAAVASSRKFKKDIKTLTESEENDLYDKLVKMPLSLWKYKEENKDHLGVITDEALPELLTTDKDHLDVVDYLGILTLALKVQHRRMVA